MKYVYNDEPIFRDTKIVTSLYANEFEKSLNKKMINKIIFDEIDSGVSGKVANQIGIMMHSMSDSNQILAITHIPQVASRGDKHIKVFKEVVESEIKPLLEEYWFDSPDEVEKSIKKLLSDL